MFESTLPFGEPELARASGFRRALESAARDEADATTSRLSTLSPSLMLDLLRFEQEGRTGGVLEVVAAGIRHGRRLLVYLQAGERVVPLTVFPLERLAHVPMALEAFFEFRLDELVVLHVEPALLRPPGDRVPALVGDPAHHHPLGRLVWELALRGSRDQLLPEIVGPAAYRVSPGVDLRLLKLAGTMAGAVERLKHETSNLRAIAAWPGFDRDRATRLLNGLYLQAGLMVSRTHPAASHENWKS